MVMAEVVPRSGCLGGEAEVAHDALGHNRQCALNSEIGMVSTGVQGWASLSNRSCARSNCGANSSAASTSFFASTFCPLAR